MREITRDEAANNIELFAREGRLVQGDWHRRGDDGRALACLLGSIDPSINAPEHCPASVMPQWLAELLPTLFDGVPDVRALDFGSRFADALRRGNTDDGVMRRWLVTAIEGAVKFATPEGEAPAYWQQVHDACRKVCDLLRANAGPDAMDAARLAAHEAGNLAAIAWNTAEPGSAKECAASAALDAAKVAENTDMDGAARHAIYAMVPCATLFDSLLAEMLRGI